MSAVEPIASRAVEVEPSPEGVPGELREPALVRAEALTFAGAGGETIGGYLARPAAGEPAGGHPGMIVIHEAGGLGAHIKDVANRFAALGYDSLLFACSSDRLDAAVDCWGGFIDAATPEERSSAQRPVPPLELAGQLRCPLLAVLGAEDQNPSPEVGARLREALSSSPHESLVEVYEQAGHAFFADYRPSYRPQAAAQLWERVVPFLDSHLRPRS